jgi:serine/threonine protein phosphatase PrpC
LAKQLRVDVAELTDIGRRRAINQDNLARRVPEDPDELARNGALFVVADGMGGHAAGEIASTVAVQTISKVYFEAASGDVLQGLAQAIKRANETILSIAQENHEHAGMGTTIVVAVICQGILYVANIGDSRAYLIRNGRIRQLTEDHSWVADQVRAGLLTEEQARAHTHRNVITRSLGTQPSVIADVFVEPVRENDILILCSDGLHGYVDEQTIAEVVLMYPPAEAAQRLVDLANDAGGSDNISVSIVHVSETAVASEELLERLRLLDDQDRPSRPMPIVASQPDKQEIPAPTPPIPLEDDDKLATQPRLRARRRRPGAVLAAAIAFLVLVVFASAAWDVVLGPFAQSREVTNVVNNDVGKVKRDIASLSTLSPAQQLALLASDQQTLQSDLKLSLTASERTEIENELNGDLTTSARQALQAYDEQANITPLAGFTTSQFALGSCPATGTNSLGAIAQLVSYLPPTPPKASSPSSPVLLARDQSGNVATLMLNAGQVSCGPTIAANVIAATNAGDHIGLLIQQPPAANSSTPGPLAVATFGANNRAPATLLTIPSQTFGQAAPTMLALSGTNVVLVAPQATGAIVYFFTGPKFNPAKPVTIALDQTPRTIAFGGNGLLYLLDNSGALATLDLSTQSFHMVGDLTIQPVLPVGDPNRFSVQTPVPTAQTSTAPSASAAGQVSGAPAPSVSYGIDATKADTGTATPTPPTATPTPLPMRTGPSTMLPASVDLSASQSSPPRVIVADPHDYRLVILQGDGADLDLIEQIADVGQLSSMTAATIAADGHTVFILAGQSILQIALP